jgi:hypothetical protein
MISVIPRKKVLIPRHFEFCGRGNSEVRNKKRKNPPKKYLKKKKKILKLGTEQISAKKLSFMELAPHGLYDYSDI